MTELRAAERESDMTTRPICGVRTTMGADGWPQSSVVWLDWDGTCARINTTLERQKVRNLLGTERSRSRHACYYGNVHPEAQRELETRVVFRIHARRVTLDAIHA